MNIQARKLELIKTIADIQNESLLERLQNYLRMVSFYQGSDKGEYTLYQRETELLTKINEGLPEPQQIRYTELMQKSLQKQLSETEHKELLSLISLMENQHVERLRHLVELATLWHCSVDEVMEKLGIQAPGVIHG